MSYNKAMKKALVFCFIVLFFCGCARKADERTVLRFSAWGSQSEIAILRPLIADFERKNPEIRVEFMHIPQNYFQKLHLLFASRLEPDVVFLNNFYSQKYIKAGLLEDLTPHFSKEISNRIFFEKAIEASTYNGRLYVVPRDVSQMVVYYNKDIFRKNGLPFPKNDWSRAEFLKTAQTLSKDGIWGVGFEKEPVFWLPFVFSDGGNIPGENAPDLDLAAREAIQFYADLPYKYNAAPKKSDSASLTMAQMFLQKRLAMIISGRWLVPKFRESADFDWDIVPVPAGKIGSISNVDSSGYAVSASSKHKNEAVLFIKFLNSPDSVSELTKSGLIVPARRDIAYSSTFLGGKPSNAAAYLKAVETGRVTPVNENYQKITDSLNTLLEPVFSGQKRF